MDCNKLFENFENIDEPLECERIGASPPAWLTGQLLRNGPGKFKYGDTEVKHWFDGMAYMQRFQLKDGKLFYSAKFLESEAYKMCEQANRLCVSSFGTVRFPDPCKGLYGRFQSMFIKEDGWDNCVVNFVQLSDAVYALTETPKVVKIDPDTLGTKAGEDLQKVLSINSCTAHPQTDLAGNVYNSGHLFGKQYVFTETKGDKSDFSETILYASVPYEDRWNPAYHHSFGMSPNYIVLFETPLRISLMKLMARNILSYSFKDTLHWKEGTNTNVIVVDRKTGSRHTIRYTAPPFFTFHHANTYEEDGFIYVDFCHMENPGTFDDLLMDHMRDGSFTKNPKMRPYLHRMVLPIKIPTAAEPGSDLATSAPHGRGAKAILQPDGSIYCESARICEHSFEFPRFNWDANNMKPYQFVYGSTLLFDEEKENLAGIVKVDLHTGATLLWHRDNEFQLCVLLVPVMTLKEDQAPVFVVLNAKNLQEICRYTIPTDRLPPAFHSLYLS
ncbi:unnamed protein product, partial [Mesorhabditis spiculigera]